MSWINLGEVYYTVHREAGAAEAESTLALLRPLLTLDAVTPERVLGAARIKAVHPLACGDAFAVATAVGVVRPARFERATTDSQLEESC